MPASEFDVVLRLHRQEVPAGDPEDVQRGGSQPADRLLPGPIGPHLLCSGEPQGKTKLNLTEPGLIVCMYVCVWLILHVFLSPQESSNMVVPAMQLASKIPDMSVQLWSSALLKGKR